ncbi:MAG: glycosyltransferase [Anaerolineae bacterium]
MRVSVIATVKNEEEAVRKLLHSLLAQTRPPDEIVIVDGGSSDGTVPFITSYSREKGLPLRIIVQPGCNISQGRNLAIASARGEIIASTDAGVRLSPNWLEDLVAPFEQRREGETGIQAPEVVSGFFLPDPQSVFEIALGATVLPVLDDIEPSRFLPSSRSVAFKREVWEKVGGYPEWLDYCEDLIFDFKLKEAGYRFAFAPTAIAYFRPRSGLKAFARQYYCYARGDGKADLWRKRHLIRYLTYLVAGPLLLALMVRQGPVWGLIPILGAAAMLWTPYKRLIPMIGPLSSLDKLKTILLVPIIRLTGDVAKMVGYPVGVWWRLSTRAIVTSRF